MTNFKKVIEFNTSFGLPHFNIEQPNILNDESKLSDLRVSLCEEEINELNEAFEQFDFIEVIDALTDELYVIYGAASSFGFDINYYLNILLGDNGSDTNYIKMINYHYKKMEYSISNYKSFLQNDNILKSLINENNGSIQYLLEKINKKIDELKNYKNTKNYPGIKFSLVYLLYYTYTLGIIMGINLDKSFDIVHMSNMSKLCGNEELAKETVKWYTENDNRYDTPSYRLSDNKKDWIIFNQRTGKILKNKYYTMANFNNMME